MRTHGAHRLYKIDHVHWTIYIVTLLLATGVLSGCVSSSTHEEVVKERDELVKKEKALKGNTQYLRNRVESTEEKAARLKSEVAEVESELFGVSKTLEEKNAHLRETSEELAHRQEELFETERRLALSNKKLEEAAKYADTTKKLYSDLVGGLSLELAANQIKISEMKDGITVNLSQEILFPSGSATLNDSGISVIKKVSESLKNIPHQIIVAGFTDNVPIKGDLTKMFPTNWELAGARAASVVRLLESQGLESAKLTAVSFGENQPVASNDDWKLRAQNRRIEIRLRPVD